MTPKELYVVKMEAQLNAWREKLDAMKDRLEEAELQGRLEFHRQVEASQHQHETACRHLDELKRSGEQAWEALNAGVDTVWKDLKKASSGEPN